VQELRKTLEKGLGRLPDEEEIVELIRELTQILDVAERNDPARRTKTSQTPSVRQRALVVGRLLTIAQSNRKPPGAPKLKQDEKGFSTPHVRRQAAQVFYGKGDPGIDVNYLIRSPERRILFFAGFLSELAKYLKAHSDRSQETGEDVATVKSNGVDLANAPAVEIPRSWLDTVRERFPEAVRPAQEFAYYLHQFAVYFLGFEAVMTAIRGVVAEHKTTTKERRRLDIRYADFFGAHAPDLLWSLGQALHAGEALTLSPDGRAFYVHFADAEYFSTLMAKVRRFIGWEGMAWFLDVARKSEGRGKGYFIELMEQDEDSKEFIQEIAISERIPELADDGEVWSRRALLMDYAAWRRELLEHVNMLVRRFESPVPAATRGREWAVEEFRLMYSMATTMLSSIFEASPMKAAEALHAINNGQDQEGMPTFESPLPFWRDWETDPGFQYI
jgi:hypothetical protein